MAIQVPTPGVQLQNSRGGAPQISNPDRNLAGVATGLKQVGGALQDIGQDANRVSAAQDAANKRVSAEQLKAAEELRHKENLTKVLEAESLTQAIVRDHVAKMQTERQGLNAKGVVEDSQTFFDDNIQQIADSLEDPDARLAYLQRATGIKDSTLDSLSSYTASQLNNALTAANTSSIASNIDFAAANAGNPKGIALGRENIIKAVENLNTAYGWAPERKQYELEKALIAMHTQVFDNLASADPEAAKQYFKNNKEEMGGNLDHFNETMKISDDLIPAQKLTDKLLREKTTFAEKYQAVRDNLTGKQRENAMQILRTEESAFNAEEKANTTALVNQAENIFAQTRNVTTLQSQFPALWAQLPGDVKLSMQDRQKTSQEQVVGDDATYLYLKQIAGLNPRAMADPSFNIGLFAAKLSLKQLEDVNNDMIKIRSGQGLGVGTLVQEVNAATAGMELPGAIYGTKKMTDTDKAQFFTAVTDKLNEIEQTQKSPVTPEQRKKVINDLSAEVTWTSGWTSLDKNTTIGQVLGSIPAGERKTIEANLKASGVAITDANIAKLYIKVHPR